ncbi:MAG: PAS domain-containing protein, partial [Verrucomicrobiales bacterium]|nr:PAS domain-containing protein [Verrucomicrobiales bacterium]
MRSYSLEGIPENSSVKVLLVDDDQDSYLLTRRMLNKIDGAFQIDWASSFESGLESVARHAHDVYLFDYRLGAHNGLELLRQALAIGCKKPIIMLTTENPEVDAEAMRLGAADFLNKERLDASLLERSIRYSIKQFSTLRALRESQAQLGSFMQNVPCALYMKDLQGRYVYVNGVCEKLFNRPPLECTGKNDDELWHKSAAQKQRETDRKVATTRKAIETTETIAKADGLHYWLATRFPILNEQGATMMIGGAAIDITERKRLEREIQEISERE